MLLCRLNIPEDEIISGYPNTPTDENDDFHEKKAIRADHEKSQLPGQG